VHLDPLSIGNQATTVDDAATNGDHV
jgi:hypothetical protein